MLERGAQKHACMRPRAALPVLTSLVPACTLLCLTARLASVQAQPPAVFQHQAPTHKSPVSPVRPACARSFHLGPCLSMKAGNPGCGGAVPAGFCIAHAYYPCQPVGAAQAHCPHMEAAPDIGLTLRQRQGAAGHHPTPSHPMQRLHGLTCSPDLSGPLSKHAHHATTESALAALPVS